jgi:hypothetical protein
MVTPKNVSETEPVAMVQVLLIPGPDGSLQVQVNASVEPFTAAGILQAGVAALLGQSQQPSPSKLVRGVGPVPRA